MIRTPNNLDIAALDNPRQGNRTMKAIVGDNGAIHPQVGYLNGYAIEERLLEDVRFKIIKLNGDLACNGVHEDDAPYMEKFSKKQMDIWCQEAVDAVKEGLEMQTENGDEDLYWVELK